MPDLRQNTIEPPEVQHARKIIWAYQHRHGHESYVHCIDGGFAGYQGKCWDCDWTGPEHLRGDEEMGTPESRVHKANAIDDAAQHQADTKPQPDWKALL